MCKMELIFPISWSGYWGQPWYIIGAKKHAQNKKEPHRPNFRDIITYIIGFLFFLFVFYMLTLNWHG